ncbi:MAG: TetR/AcrR family transcriptional regulator [Acidobacteria bacterium]|nr:TetR/AcrR family transcriptional regulator [Acidobacteriota bacterium]
MAERARTYHHGDLRVSLVEEAAAMISEAGAASVTMRAIGGRLGVSRGAPYRHFPDKTALLVAVAVEGFKRLNRRLGASDTGASPSSVEQLRRMGEQYVRFALEHPAHYRLMYGKEALERQDQPELRRAAGALLENLVDVIRVHQQRGDIEGGDPRAQAYVAWSAVHGLASLLIERQIDPNVDVDDLILQTTQTILDGMRDRSPD